MTEIGYQLLAAFASTFLIGLVLTPLCRMFSVKMGMVDLPSKRRINKKPIPRAGGLAIYISFAAVMLVAMLALNLKMSPIVSNTTLANTILLGGVLCLVGLVDDKWGMKPIIKFACQIAVAVMAAIFCDVGFRFIPALSWLPVWADIVLTVFWIVGAINAFNLIDGIDGLASGLAIIAALGMAGALIFIGYRDSVFVLFAFIGACSAFLCYNFNPASVFLGDTGSMFLGFMLAVLPLQIKAGDSLFVSLGVPILSMGVPIFDTSLAIVRRSIRALLKKKTQEISGDSADVGNDKVMTADLEHVHHRLLRTLVSQKKVAISLYVAALVLVMVALGGILLRDKAAALFIIAFIVAIYVILRDMRRVELLDTGTLLNMITHNNQAERKRSLLRALKTPILMICDIAIIVFSWHFARQIFSPGMKAIPLSYMIYCVAPVFFMMCVGKVYSVVWARATFSNFVRLGVCVVLGKMFGLVVYIFAHSSLESIVVLYNVIFVVFCFLGLTFLRVVRQVFRELFYRVDVENLKEKADTKRVLVYGSGLRYRAFRRELIRSFSSSDRTIVGLIDDDFYLQKCYIGGVKIFGMYENIPDVIKALKVDMLVVACIISDEKTEELKEMLKPLNVSMSLFTFNEIDILKNENKKG